MTEKLDPTVTPKVNYCIPLWLRDEQIIQSIARIKDRVEVYEGEPRPEPIAVVCYGPSLNDTWRAVTDFRYVISCSGSHRFLLERGIVPTWHVEVDPRPHKAVLMGPPHPDVEYLISSTCHGKVFDHLEGYRVRLWHVFDSAEEGIRTLPHGEWALTGGCNVGLRAMTMAGFLGFRDLHIFGMDGCEGASGKHAAAHPNQPKKSDEVEYPPGSGIIYRTTAGMLAAAQGTFHELNQMPGVGVTFYGEGLVQAMAKDYVPKPVTLAQSALAYRKDLLISPEYAALNARLHRENLAYGVGGGKHAETVLELSKQLQTTSILDYGCGKGYLGKALPFPIWEYDPAIAGKAASPRPADLVVCTDVLEHIEPDHLEHVLRDLRRCTKIGAYLVIHTGPASKTLPDGRNTHLIQEGEAWWRARLDPYFTVTQCVQRGPQLHVLIVPRKTSVKRLTKQGVSDARAHGAEGEAGITTVAVGR